MLVLRWSMVERLLINDDYYARVEQSIVEQLLIKEDYYAHVEQDIVNYY